MLPQVALSALQLGVPVVAPALVADLGMSPEAVGLVGGCIGFGSVWMFTANHAITPAFGPLKALAAACALSVVGGVLIVSGVAAAVFAGAVLVGFAYAVTAPAGSQILSARVPEEYWGTVFSIRQAGVPLGGAIAGVAGAGLAVSYGWEVGLLCLAALPLVSVGLLLAAPRVYHAGASGARFRPGRLFDPSNVARPFRTLRAMPQLRRLTLASLGFAGVQGSVFPFLTTYLTDGLGLGLGLAGTLFAVMQVASFAGRVGVGVIADRQGRFRPVLMGMALASAAASVVLAVADGGWPMPAFFVIAAVTGVSVATWNGLFLAEIARLVPREDVSRATAGVTFFTFIAYMLTPPVFGMAVFLAGYQTAFLMSACAALFGFACLRTMQEAGAVESDD